MMSTVKQHELLYHLFRGIVCFLIAGLLVMGFFSRRGWLDWRRMVHKSQELNLEMKNLAVARVQLEKQIEAFEKNKSEQERVIRSRLGYVHPDEIVVEFE